MSTPSSAKVQIYLNLNTSKCEIITDDPCAIPDTSGLSLLGAAVLKEPSKNVALLHKIEQLVKKACSLATPEYRESAAIIRVAAL